MPGSNSTIIGVDAGTSVIKAVAFDLSGRMRAKAERSNHYRILENGGAEQDMNATWAALADTLAELVNKLPGEVLAIAVTGQGDGTWLVDHNGEPQHNAWLWLDARAINEIAEIRRGPLAEKIFQHTGTGLSACQMGAHLLWMKKHDPLLLRRSAHALHCKDWLYFKLTGTIATDCTESVFSFGDFRKRDYSNEVLAAFGLEEFRHLLPPIIDGTRTSHGLNREAATAIGLKAGTPVCMGLVDVMCCALGAGLHNPRDRPGLAILGSTGMHMRFVENADAVVLNADRTGYTMCFPDGSLSQMQTNMAATLNIDWILGLARQILAEHGTEANEADLLHSLDDRLESTSPGKVMFHPYISSAGERGPFINPAARASFTGLDQSAGWNDLVRAVFDGVALAACDCFRAMQDMPRQIRVAGGGAKSRCMRQWLASALERPVVEIRQPEAGACGAAMMASVRLGLHDDLTTATEGWVVPMIGEVTWPDPAQAEIYRHLFARYDASRKCLEPLWRIQSGKDET